MVRLAGCFLPSPSEGNIARYAGSAEALICNPTVRGSQLRAQSHVVSRDRPHSQQGWAQWLGLAVPGWPLPSGCLPAESRAHSLYHQDNFTSFTLTLKNSFCGVEFRAGTHTQTKGFPQEMLKGILSTVM